MIFIQTIYYSLMTGAEIPWFVQEFLKLLSYSSFEFATFPHIITDYIFDTDKTKEDIYP